jgi:ABC-type glycerol-3-phosphate transport system permease component
MQITASDQTYRKRKRWNLILRHAIINFFMLVILLPLAWVFLLSIKSIPDAYTGKLWPDQFDFTHYQYVIEKIDTLLTNLFNSIYVTGATVAITCVAAVLAGYALVHLELPGQKFIILGLIASLYFPIRVVSLISIFEIQRFLG